MDLTSNYVLVLTVLTAVALFAATIRLWPRLAATTWRTVAGRVGLLLATQLMLFASVGLAANNAFGFYASWADLFGQEQRTGTVVDHRSGPDGTGLQHLGVERTSLPGGRRHSGRIDRILLRGDDSGITSPAHVYLPPQYFRPAYAHKRFPAVVVLTGYPGTAEALYTKLHYPDTARRLVREGRAEPAILIMMRPTVAPPRDTECMDIPGGPQTETFFTRDLRADISAHYRTGTDPRGWGIIGDSTGGYCALKLTLRHPEAYSSAVALSGYYRAPLDPTTGDLFGGDPQLQRENDLMWRQRHLPAPKVNLLVTTSRQGENNYADTLRFIQQTKAPTRISSIVLASGGHNFNTWRREIPPALTWLSQRLTV